MSSQSGSFDAALVIITNTGATYVATVQYAGTGYTTGDTFIFRGSLFSNGSNVGTSPANDLTLTVTAGTVNGLPNAVSSLTVSGTAPAGTVNIATTLEYPNNRTARDSSDVTRMLKERIIYNEKRTGSAIQTGKTNLMVGGRPQVNPAGVNHVASGNAEVLWTPQGNQYRLSYLKGKMGCGGGSGGVFNLNGPLSGS